MRKAKFIFIVLCIILVSFVCYSCSQDDDDDETMSISARIDKFIDDLNNNSGNVYTNCHPAAGQYNQAKSGTYWSQNFGTGVSLSGRATTGSTVTATVSGGNFSGKSITFSMQEDGTDNWKIRTISVAAFSFN
ncbi:MAG: hypothetical protein LBT68_05360 [Spirochaetales bacterium]|jgi:hypothetical protein|nr:hypothetical protein [Spirochaetales bacterium]